MEDVGTPNTVTAPETLGDWQALLRRAFFDDRDAAEPFILDLEVSEEIRLWAGGGEDLRSNLASCVALELDLDSSADIFGPLRLAWRQWSAGSRTAVPPNLAVLTLTVAAATEMHRAEDVVQHAYYYRLAELLTPQASRDALLALRDRLRESFEPVADWWRGLSEWVESNPQVGINTIQGHAYFTRIGYPMSQAVIRRSDRMRLTRFFEKLDLNDLGVPTADALVAQLEIWTATPRDLSPTLLGALADPTKRSVLAAYLHRLASAWDGVVLTPEGAIHLDIRLAIDLDDFTSRWVIRTHPDKSDLDVQVNDDEVKLTRPEYGDFYDWHGFMPSVQSSSSAPTVTAKGPGVSGKFVFPPLQPLRANPDVGWLSEDDVQPYTPHILLVAPAWQAQVEKVLDAAARTGWRRLDQKPGAQLVVGRVVYIKVEIEDAGAFKKALGEVDPSLARALRTSAGFRPQIVHGLRVFTNLGARHYLRGGEPDLLLPIGEAPRSVPSALDGTAQTHPFHTTGFPIPLRKIGPLDVGQHVLDVDGETIKFDVHEPDAAQHERPTVLGWVRAGSSNKIDRVPSAAVGTTAISGAVVNGDMREPRLLRRLGRHHYVTSRRGAVVTTSPPPRNPLFEQTGIPESTLWEYTPPADAIWFIEERSNGHLSVELLRYAEPHFGQLDSTSLRLWAEMAMQLKEDNPLLDMHLQAFERMNPHAG